MYMIYGKNKESEDNYQLLNVNRGEFVNRRIHASLIATWEQAERICFELEQENPEYFFEARSS